MRPPEYEGGFLTIRPWCSVNHIETVQEIKHVVLIIIADNRLISRRISACMSPHWVAVSPVNSSVTKQTTVTDVNTY
jgi:hypothetical protein